MPLVDSRTKVLFLPVIRGHYDHEMTRAVGAALREAVCEAGIDALFPPAEVGADGLIASEAHVRDYRAHWAHQTSEIKAVVAFSSDFMQERAVMETARVLPEDVPVFLIVNNDNPAAMDEGPVGDSLCGSLSVHHNLRMLGRRITRSCRIDMNHAETLLQMLRDYMRLADGIEALRNMRVATIGVNPDAFATTFSNQMELFRLGFSLHSYELLEMWGDVVLGGQLQGEESDYGGEWGEVSLSNPIRRDDKRVRAARERIADAGCDLPEDEGKCDLIARYFLWLQSTFERDRIDAAAIHCWPQVRRFFGIGAPCAFAMLSNFLLEVPVVCEGDICHAIMAKLAATASGEPGVILDVNNNGWDPRVFNAFHCSQTPPNWLVDGGRVSDYGSVTGRIAPVPFTGVAAATSADAFHAVVFTGHFLEEDAGSRGSSGWAYVPNFPEVLRTIEETGIHHFVAAKGNVARNVAEALEFRGLVVRDLSREVGTLEEIRAELPPLQGGEGPCRIYSR